MNGDEQSAFDRSAGIFLALAGDEFGPLLLCMDHGDALKSHPRLVGDHLVQGQLYFGPVHHSNFRDSLVLGFAVQSIASLEGWSVRARVQELQRHRHGTTLRAWIP